MNILELRDIIQDCNLNFLIGSGMSRPFLDVLGNIESLLTELSRQRISQKRKEIIEVSLYKRYFDGVMLKNLDILNSDTGAVDVLSHYKELLKSFNGILLNRKSTILNKQVNLFTTNIDIFLEKALDELGIEHNDGFAGRFHPKFSLNTFRKSAYTRSFHYDNTSELPVFNLLKLHGSLTWKSDDAGASIEFSPDLRLVKDISLVQVPDECLIPVDPNTTIDQLVSESANKTHRVIIRNFLKTYRKLIVVNPTKEKFQHTLFNQNYYDMLRIYSNQLEKENTVLFVMGFSFADEHIRDLTLRVANSNPTLVIYIFAHTTYSVNQYTTLLNLPSIKNNNIKFIKPEQGEIGDGGVIEDKYKLDLSSINKYVISELLASTEQHADFHERKLI